MLGAGGSGSETRVSCLRAKTSMEEFMEQTKEFVLTLDDRPGTLVMLRRRDA